ncbi:MAG: DUF4263 domain-containing protein [Sphingobacteriales bacterium]|uniref:Shedu anti-phage system protein SduA domain-containing protein n=1 Tax=uncultured Dysgonomonas sp. TaxID=206096 RepID=UPI0009601938|nr:Shedu anti-phage system protein SduA domain-containing protein [uncultured Dysgonomonas sp.]MBN8857033.1 DUF4263 domain-containing protein [Sphingobacteriales bacterium]OJY89341.1 MAG: hypothetical protein BGP14_05410 [Sphingobacteriales bacterium 44-15]
MLYDRDYKILTEEEKKIWEKVESIFIKEKTRKKGGVSVKGLDNYYKNLPTAALHYQQLFPNNYLDADSYCEKENYTTLQEFKVLLGKGCTEQEILNFIRVKKAYFIITSLFGTTPFNFGHHVAFAFKEFELPSSYVVDFLLVGKNSGGYEFIFVELESPHGLITTADGEFGACIRKGIKQVEDWDIWLEKHYSSLKLVYNKYLGNMHPLPLEFYELDKSRLHYVVVAGRRKNFNQKTYQAKRRLLKSKNILVLHYDNLIDNSIFLLKHRYKVALPEK